ncbi:MAG: outer membrane lipoprotein carrier protein LolA [Mucilaginibacter sp.]|nr:outer membrane lipoprotein carrier protein LolA [Mucilaginibacter sp.]
MKKLLLYLLLTGLTFNYAFAQKDADARKILNQVSAKYRSYDVIKTDFTFTCENPQAGTKDSQMGTMISKSKVNKYKVTIFNPEDKLAVDEEIISDGKSQWTYVKKNKEVELTEVDNSSESMNPAQIFTIYEKGYKYIYTGDAKVDGKLCQVIDLTPEDEKKPFFKIRLSIDKAKKQIFSALIFDKNGSRYNYIIRTFVPNVKVPESTFVFDKKNYPGAELVDLR